MHSYYLEQRGGRIHCLQFGSGQRLLVALHGFGDRARLFASLESTLGKRYTVVALDLPFHGQTEWPHESFGKADLLAVIEQIRQRLGYEQIALMGFSFGARLAQAMLTELLPRLERLFLLAPDGIRTRGMYLAVRTPLWLRRWLARVVERPERVLHLAAWGCRLGLVSPIVMQFLRFNLVRPERRRRVLGCWLALHEFSPRRGAIRAIWKQSGLPVDIFIGTEDEVVHREALRYLARGLPNVRIFQLPRAGHRIVSEGLVAVLKELLVVEQ